MYRVFCVSQYVDLKQNELMTLKLIYTHTYKLPGFVVINLSPNKHLVPPFLHLGAC